MNGSTRRIPSILSLTWKSATSSRSSAVTFTLRGTRRGSYVLTACSIRATIVLASALLDQE